MALHEYGANLLLDGVFGTGAPLSFYVALTATKPAFGATTLSEPSAVDYARLEIPNNAMNFGAAANGIMTNLLAWTFPAATNSWGTIGYAVLTGHATSIDVVSSAQVTARVVNIGGTVKIPVGLFTLKLR